MAMTERQRREETARLSRLLGCSFNPAYLYEAPARLSVASTEPPLRARQYPMTHGRLTSDQEDRSGR